MKRIIILAAAFLLLAFSANAQMVGSTNNSNYGRYTVSGARSGWSYGVSGVLSKGFNNDDWNSYQYSYGLWAEGGYYILPQLYAGVSLGFQVRRETYGDVENAPRLLFGARYFFSPAVESFFVDGRFGAQIDDPFEKYGRTELSLGYIFANHLEISAGLENEMWDALDGFGEFIRTKGFFVRVGYRFK